MNDEILELSVDAHDALIVAAHKLEGVLLKLESGQHFQLADRELAALRDYLAHAERLIAECQSSNEKATAILSPRTGEDIL